MLVSVDRAPFRKEPALLSPHEKGLLGLCTGGWGALFADNNLMVGDRPFSETIKGLETLDASDNVLTILAHDWTLKGVIEKCPKALNG